MTIERGLRRDFTFDLLSRSEPVDRVFMMIEGERGIVYQRWYGGRDREEITVFCSLAPGSYTVSARTDEGLEGRTEFTVSGSEEADVIRVILR